MWPFSRRPKFQLPSWTFRSVDEEHSILSLSLGKWLATDGAYLTKDSVELGHIAARDGFLDLSRRPDGLESVTFGYKSEVRLIQQAGTVLVIDSGEMVICCEDALKEAGIIMSDHRTSDM